MSYREFFIRMDIDTQESKDASGEDILSVRREDLTRVVEVLQSDRTFVFDMLLSVIGLDCGSHFEVLYNFVSTKNNKKLMLKTGLPKEQPSVESLCGLYSAANWHEREVYDLLGIEFLNHPKLERILMPKDWIGHPLRKDYKEEEERLSWNRR